MEPGDTPPTDDEDEREGRDPGTETTDADDGGEEGDGGDGLPEDGPFGGNDRQYAGADSERDSGTASTAADAPSPERGTAAAEREAATGDGSGADADLLSRFLHAKSGPLMWTREFLSSAVVVLAVGLLLFGISGVWPPMVAVESGSMEPNMEKGDLIVVTEPGRFAPDVATAQNGIVTQEEGQSADYRTFGGYGSVVVFDDPRSGGSPIIHRAHLRVEEGENWYDRANEEYMSADSCAELRNCPAPATGYITKGDNNAHYDQAQGIARVVRDDWVTGVARLRIPYLGWIRLIATGQATLFGGTAFSGTFGGAFSGVAGAGAGLIGAGAVATRRRA
ncbi:S26 family signal peptidase [Haloparvum alkalitolerans]|uniref:S26 family signal peptidase n=1 Tax=Haloparvum alkalitolerans TaxID=1042953 RepID=UPI003CF1B89E